MGKFGSNPDHQRRQQVIPLRSQGLTFLQIAQQLGVTRQAAMQLFNYAVGPENDPLRKPPLTVANILVWADAHKERTGRWPSANSGVIAGVPNETWNGVNLALTTGVRGLPGRSSLAKLLAEHRGKRHPRALPRLTVRQILRLVQIHHDRTGRWPNAKSGPVEGVPGETWQSIDTAIKFGWRGLPGGSTLIRLIEARWPDAMVYPRPRRKRAVRRKR